MIIRKIRKLFCVCQNSLRTRGRWLVSAANLLSHSRCSIVFDFEVPIDRNRWEKTFTACVCWFTALHRLLSRPPWRRLTANWNSRTISECFPTIFNLSRALLLSESRAARGISLSRTWWIIKKWKRFRQFTENYQVFHWNGLNRTGQGEQLETWNVTKIIIAATDVAICGVFCKRLNQRKFQVLIPIVRSFQLDANFLRLFSIRIAGNLLFHSL